MYKMVYYVFAYRYQMATPYSQVDTICHTTLKVIDMERCLACEAILPVLSETPLFRVSFYGQQFDSCFQNMIIILH